MFYLGSITWQSKLLDPKCALILPMFRTWRFQEGELLLTPAMNPDGTTGTHAPPGVQALQLWN